MAALKTPFLFLRLFLDQGTQYLSGNDFTYGGQRYSKRVIDWGNLDISVSIPAGSVEISDVTVTLHDGDGYLKKLFSERTPKMRLGSIFLDWEENAAAPPVDLQPIFTGEITSVQFPMFQCTITFKNALQAWMDREIPGLIVRDNFPNMPDGLEWDFAPIVLGICLSTGIANVEKQGVINCPFIDRVNNYYCAARHECAGVPNVYRKEPHDQKFKLVRPAEYEIINVDYEINGYEYTFTIIHFFNAQYETTLIQADIAGFPQYYDFNSATWVNALSENAVDCLVNLLTQIVEDEASIGQFDSASFIQTKNRITCKQYVTDGAITGHPNTKKGITIKEAISQICGSVDMDFYQSLNGKIKVWFYIQDDVMFSCSGITSDTATPIDPTVTLNDTFEPQLPDKVYTRQRYRYLHQNAQLTEYVHSSSTGQWGFDLYIDNKSDLLELSGSGFDGLLEKENELFFVRDDNTAREVVRRRMALFSLRSYSAPFKLPLPELFNPASPLSSFDIVAPVSITHYNGIGVGGWNAVSAKVIGVTADFNSLELSVKALVIPIIPAEDFLYSFPDGSEHTAPPATYSNPQYPVTIGATSLDPEPSDVNQTINHAISIDTPVDFDPADPTTFPEDRDQVESMEVAYDNVGNPLSPRQLYMWVKAGRIVTVTLHPDTRPTDWTNADIGRLVYAVDFDRFYMFTGTGDFLVTPWMGVNWDGGVIGMFFNPPATNGWHLCDGSSGVRVSAVNGSTSLETVPDLRGYYLKGGSSVSGPHAATAPTLSGAIVTIPSHSHTYSGSTATDGAHSHTISSVVTDVGHSHGLNLVDTGIESATHTHALSSASISVSISTDGSHSHSYSGTTDSDGAHTHTYNQGPAGGSITSESVSIDQGSLSPITAAGSGDSIITDLITGSVTDSDGLHTHTYSGATDTDGAHTHTASGSLGSLTLGSDSVDHHHQINGQFTDLHNTGISVASSISPADGTHSHSYSGTTSSDGAGVYDVTGGIISDSGEPPNYQLVPYIRL